MYDDAEPAVEQCSRTITILKLLFEKFKRQTLAHQAITFFVIILGAIGLLLFYSSFLIWQALSYLMTHGILRTLEWYLKRDGQARYY
jgi:hypothetical protein